MSKSDKKLPFSNLNLSQFLNGQNIVFMGLLWSSATVFFFLSYSITPPGQDSPFWYLIGTYIWETVPFIFATWLCYRNWKSPQIASGSDVWLYMGLGLGSYSLANFIFGIWELYFGLDPEISPADLFYLLFTVFITWGMVLAVLPRRLNLEWRQWLIVAGVAFLGIASAIWLTFGAPEEGGVETPPPTPTEQAAPAPDPYADVPGLIEATDKFLRVFARPVNLFYTISDIIFLIIASTLLLAFWGGRFSRSWQMIAAAALAKYIADMWLKYATTLPDQYESGGFLEVFYVFSGVLFAIGAALEYDVSTSRSGRSRRRRGGG
ncbi:hypothetical protein PN462_03280 [Spirulina sp. CS-785/01]|uniref:hypothetical protein n=1 Tax=Spirulina sp. CS-785/01 TaxID=3021716 RepID=UPI00232E8274|nr:hypothetical protein [Spirulina sp. CS-785/01]MDB9312111.1 hypothetical protein [Spirulina sp. CS-785/01]